MREPKAVYKKERLRIFHSFEEAEETELQKAANQKPVERLRETVELILRIYGFSRQQLLERPPDDALMIVKQE